MVSHSNLTSPPSLFLSFPVCQKQLKKSNESLISDYHEEKVRREQVEAEKISTERECEQLYKQWNRQAKKQADELLELQARMVPTSEIDNIRQKLVTELEYPHQQKVEALKNEVTKYVEAYHKERRENEMTKQELSMVKSEQEKAFHSLKEQHRLSYEEIQQRNRQLEELVKDTSLSDTLRAVERENAELILKQKSILEEMSGLR